MHHILDIDKAAQVHVRTVEAARSRSLVGGELNEVDNVGHVRLPTRAVHVPPVDSGTARNTLVTEQHWNDTQDTN